MLYNKVNTLTFDDIAEFYQNELADVSEVMLSLTANRTKVIMLLVEHIMSTGGKKLRALLTIIFAKSLYYRGNRHLNIAAAVEFIHNATLLHDDVIDSSNVRRNKQTANTIWGNKSSILVGDFLFSQSFMIMVTDNNIEVLRTLSAAAAIISEGEVIQLEKSYNIDLSVAEYLQIVYGKTAALFGAAAKVGIIIAEGKEQQQFAAENYGVKLGIGFQIIDDCLDYIPDSNLGKNCGEDFFEGKITLPIIILLLKAAEHDREIIIRKFSQDKREISDIQIIRDMMSNYQVMQECYNMAKENIVAAQQELKVISDNIHTKHLDNIADLCLTRLAIYK